MPDFRAVNSGVSGIGDRQGDSGNTQNQLHEIRETSGTSRARIMGLLKNGRFSP